MYFRYLFCSNSTIGRPGSSVPLSMTISKSATSSATNVAVGRQDGTIDIFTIMNDKQHQQHRLLQLVGYPTRGISFMEDGCLFIAGNDNGTICLWDVSRNRSDPNGAATNHNSYNTSSQHHQQPPVLVHHVLNSNSSNESSWIVDIQPLEDNRRFVTLHMDKTIQIWKLGQSLNQQHPVHTFQLDNVCWTIQRHGNDAKQRLISGSENGWIQIFSLE